MFEFTVKWQAAYTLKKKKHFFRHIDVREFKSRKGIQKMRSKHYKSSKKHWPGKKQENHS